MNHYKITSATRHLALALLTGFVLTSCGGGGGGGGGSGNTTQSQPVAIVAGILLQGATSETTANSTYTLSGNVILQSEGTAPTVTWRVTDKPDVKGTVALTNNIFTADVALSPGDNIIEVVANDGQAQPVVYSKIITRNAQAAFNGNLNLSNDIAFVNEVKQITARIALKATVVDSTTVRVVIVGTNGTETDLAPLVDNGDLNSGDDIAGDGVYSGKFTVSEAKIGKLSYRVKSSLVASTIEVRSEIRSVSVVEHTSDASFQAAIAIQTSGNQKLLAAAVKSDTDLKAAATSLAMELKTNPDVSEAAVSNSGMSVSVMYKNGIAGVIGEPRSGTKGAGSATVPLNMAMGRLTLKPESAPLFALDSGSTISNIYTDNCDQRVVANNATGNIPRSARALAANTNTVPSVGSNRVYALAANYAGWGEDDDVPILANMLSQQPCLDVTYKKTTISGQGSVEDFKNLGDYGIVLISSHGDTHFTTLGFNNFSAGLPLFTGWAPSSAQVVIWSNMAATNAAKATYEEDLKAGRLVLWGNTFGIMPSFIEKYTGKMANSIVYMSICRGSWNGTMANAFLANGAKAYLGYSDYVNVPFTITEGTNLFNTLITPGKTLADAFVPGHKDPGPLAACSVCGPAEFRLFGTSSISAIADGLQNGDFESGVLAGWSAVGDGRVIAQLGIDASPQTGAYMAIISTGLGNTVQNGEISQIICLGNATTLTYKWNFFSEEYMEFVGSIYQDSFIVTLEEAGMPGTMVVIQQSTVDGLASGVSKVSVGFDIGDVYATGWRTTSFVIPAQLVGKKVLLKFSTSDVGDSIYDTAVLLDSITLQ